MKKIVSILLSLILLVGLVPMSAFAGSHPSDNAPALDWEQYAEYAQRNTSNEDAAEAYKKAAEKYCEYIKEEVFYFGPARDCYNKAIELFKDEKMYDKVLKCYEALGDAAFGCGKNQEARDAYKKAGELAEETDTEDWYFAVLQEKLGDAYMSLKVYRDAAFEYGHALQKTDSSNETYGALCLKYAQALEADGLASDPEGEMIIARAFTDAAGALVIRGSEEEAIAVMKNGVKHYEKAGMQEYAQRAYAAFTEDESKT